RMPPYEKSMEIMLYKQRECLATRKDEVCTIRSKFPNKLPVIVKRYLREEKLPLLDKTTFLVPGELTLGQFLSLLRCIVLEASQALHLVISGKNMSYPDGFLYITYASQDIGLKEVTTEPSNKKEQKSDVTCTSSQAAQS
uniref:Microtubule-associated protein 1 light chain 3 gamma, like n=1 Tax=Sinocyclocheilus anshuiensis TaxID=1608454 RepID=A0A671KT96_9TELE